MHKYKGKGSLRAAPHKDTEKKSPYQKEEESKDAPNQAGHRQGKGKRGKA